MTSSSNRGDDKDVHSESLRNDTIPAPRVTRNASRLPSPLETTTMLISRSKSPPPT